MEQKRQFLAQQLEYERMITEASFIQQQMLAQSNSSAGGGKKPSTQSGPSPLLLDKYSGAVHAYSLRKISNTYSGPAIRVRRSSDNAEQDIGFASNELDQSSLTSFVGSGTGYVVEWYDQSGNDHTLERTSALTQPIIVNAGTLNELNEKPVIIASNKLFTQKTTAATVTQPYTFVSVAKTFNQGGFFFNSSTTPKVGMSSAYVYWNFGQPTYTFASPGFSNSQDIISGRFTGTQSKVYVNDNLRLGPADATTGDYKMGNMGNNFQTQEYIVFDADYDSVISDINTEVNNYYGTY